MSCHIAWLTGYLWESSQWKDPYINRSGITISLITPYKSVFMCRTAPIKLLHCDWCIMLDERRQKQVVVWLWQRRRPCAFQKARRRWSKAEWVWRKHTHGHACAQENCTRTALDIIFYLLLILFTSRCQFEWQVAEHFRVCLLASTWGCQSLTGIHSVCRREAAPRWLSAVCLSWKCSASAGQQREGRRG